MKTLKHIIFPGLALVAALVSCKKETAPVSVPEEKAPQVYALSVDATKGADVKALSLDGKTLNAAWAVGEQVAVYNVTKSAALGGYLEAQSAGASTTLKGSLTGTVEAGDELRLLFLKPIYSAQNGTLAYIASNCDYAVATVTVASVSDGNITTDADAAFENQQAIVKFTLKDKDGNDLNASSLTIAAASNRLLKGQFHNTPETKHTGYTVTDGTGGFSDAESHTSLLDGNKGTKWCANNGPWNVTFNTASPVQVDGYTLTTGGDTWDNSGRNPKNWTLKGKLNESDEWTTIATVTDDNTMPAENTWDVDFVVDNPGSYQYFYFEVTANKSGDTMQLAELQLWKGTDATTSFYGPITITPASATNELTVALHNANGADTYTLTANVGGKNYTFEKSGVNFVDGKYYEITVKMAHAVTWTASDMSGLYVPLHGVFADYNTIKGITVTSGDGGVGQWYWTDIYGESGTLTFTSSVGNIKSIVISAQNVDCSDSPTGWTLNYYNNPMTLSWSGTPSTTVDLPIGSGLIVHNISSIVFTLE